MSCPRCLCSDCEAERARAAQTWPSNVPYETPCAFDLIAKDYAAKGKPIPKVLGLVCYCKRCRLTCL